MDRLETIEKALYAGPGGPVEDIAWLISEVKRLRKVTSEDEMLDRLRTIVDEHVGMQPILGWDELLTLVEQKFSKQSRAVHDLSSVGEAAHLYLLGRGSKAVLQRRLREARERGCLGWIEDAVAGGPDATEG